MSSSTLRIVAMLATILAMCLAAVGCGNQASPTAAMPANQVLARATADLKAVRSFTISGTADEQGHHMTLRLSYKHGTGCEGTMSETGNGNFDIVMIGRITWIKPDATFWQTQIGLSDSQAALLAGKYLKASTSASTLSSLTGICAPSTLTSSLPANAAKGGVTTVDGEQALPLTDKVKGVTVYVSDTASPQILRLVTTKQGDQGTANFAYGPVTLTAPPATQIAHWGHSNLK